jgi:PHP family Zn ribbon phosphoesterase
VLNRIQELAVRPEGFKPEGTIPFKSLVPLQEVIADALGVMVGAKQVAIEYDNLIKAFGSEFGVLLGPNLNELQNVTQPQIAQGIINVREGKVTAIAGYDGVFGKIKVFGNNSDFSQPAAVLQKKLF